MRGRFTHQAALVIFLMWQINVCIATKTPDPNQSTKYLDAVREFADNVLKYGRDTYGPKHTPLFVDGLNIHTHEPVKWIAPNGDRWILSNLASQQNLFRVLDGLTTITGDPKYRQAAMEAIEYAFANLRTPNGLLYWGAYAAYDALGDEPCGGGLHVFKAFYPYYELMWQVDPEATRQIIESFWASHILDWSNLEMDRIGPLDRLSVPKGWEYEYKGGPVFFKSRKRSIASTGSDLCYAAAILSKLSGEKQPLTWGKRLAQRYVETRDPKTGISTYVYTLHKDASNDLSKHPLADDFKGQVVQTFLLFPPGIEQTLDPIVHKCKLGYFIVSPDIPYTYVCNPWTCYLLVGELLGGEGREFTQWALEELTARGKVAYRKTDNVYIPMLPDGTSLEGYAYKEDVVYGPKGTIFKPISAVPMDFWGYALAYRVTGNEFMWEMARDIAQGNGLGDIGVTPENEPKLQIPTDHFDPYTLLALLELYRKTEKTEFLQAARKVGGNILASRLHKGFFVPSSKHIYAKFDAIEALALLHLDAAICRKALLVPQVWPGRPLFNASFRDKKGVVDNALIYTLTASPEPPRSLQEAAACGDVEELKSLIAQGVDVNGREGLSLYTPLYHAVINGHKEVVDLLLAKGAKVDARIPGGTALHHAAEKGHKEIVELLIAEGADVNAENAAGETPFDVALQRNHRDIVELLVEKGADVNTRSLNGTTPLHIASWWGYKAIVELLIAKGADANDDKQGRGWRPLHDAADEGHVAVAKILISKGADINAKPTWGGTPLHYACGSNRRNMVEFLIVNGADINAKDNNGKTALSWAVEKGHTEIVELLCKHAADLESSSEPVNDVTVTGVSALSRGPRSAGKYMDNIADKIFTGDPNSCLGEFVSLGKDINGDGYDDMIIGASRSKKGQGRVYIFYGRENPTFDVPDLTLTGEDIYNAFSHTIEMADFNNDNYADVAIGAPRYNSWQGRAYIYYGGPDFDATADKVFEGETGTTGAFGKVAAGDINNDGCADLLVTALLFDSKRGRAYLFYGAPGTDMDTVCDLTFDGENPNDEFGRPTPAVGDVDGDHYDDVIIGTRNYPSGKKDGRAYLYYGAGGTSMDNICDLVFNNQSAREAFGNNVELFDIDNDGRADILIGARACNRFRGRVYLYWGADRTSMDAIPDLYFTGEENSPMLGSGGMECGYANNDNFGDIIMTGINWPKSNKIGRSYLFYGNTKSEMDTTCDMTFTGENDLDRFGMDVGIGDINGDNFGDILIGARSFKSNSWQGRAYLYYGGPLK